MICCVSKKPPRGALVNDTSRLARMYTVFLSLNLWSKPKIRQGRMRKKKERIGKPVTEPQSVSCGAPIELFLKNAKGEPWKTWVPVFEIKSACAPAPARCSAVYSSELTGYPAKASSENC